MKYIPVPEVTARRIVNLFDEEMFNSTTKDGSPKPYVVTYHEFLLTRTVDEAFQEHGGSKTGIDLIELLQLARAQIKATRGVSSGVHCFDDEVCMRLRQAILHPKTGKLGPTELEHNFIDWVLLWKAEPRSELPAVLQQHDGQPAVPDGQHFARPD